MTVAEIIKKVNLDREHFGPMAKYRHYKGGLYVVICTPKDKENPDDVRVCYRSRQDGECYYTTLADWFSFASPGVRRYEPCDGDGRVHVR